MASSKLIRYVTQFLDPKFNPERRGALQMLAVAPLAPKLKLAQGALGQAGIDPVEFYRGLMTEAFQFHHLARPLDPKFLESMGEHASGIVKGHTRRLSRAIQKELPESLLYENWKRWGDGPHERDLDNMVSEAREQAHESLSDMWHDESQRDLIDWPESVRKAQDDDEVDHALDEYVNSMSSDDLIRDYGYDELISDYLNAKQGQRINSYVTREAERLGMKPDELVRQLQVDKTLKQLPKIGHASRMGQLDDLNDVPEWYYQDPEALKYAHLRSMLDNPVLTPNQMMELAGDPTRALEDLTPERLGSKLYYDMRNRSNMLDNWYQPTREQDPAFVDRLEELNRFEPDRVPEPVRQRFMSMFDELPQDSQTLRRHLAKREPDLMRVEDLTSYLPSMRQRPGAPTLPADLVSRALMYENY